MTKIVSAVRLVALLALGYALLGWAGLAAAIPPGYASPVFPAAGFALACILTTHRGKAVFGIWLGSFLLNISHSAVTPSVVAIAATIASGATLQAWVGGWLVCRWQAPFWRELEREKDALSFLLLGGILAAVISPSFGVSSMYFFGIIEKAEFLYTWWNWYVGDALGVLIFAPLTMCFVNGGSALWRQRRRLIVFPMLFMISMAFIACFMTARWEKQMQDNYLRTDGEFLANRINDRLVTHRVVLASLSHFIEVTPDLFFQQFHHFSQMILNDNPDIFALSFNDLVPDDYRAAFEEKMSGLSPLGPYQITERNWQGELVRAATRPEYVAVRYIVPLIPNKLAVGYDINSEPVRQEAIANARALNDLAVTGPIQLVQDEKKRIGLLELQPVTIAIEGDPPADGSKLSGFVVGVIKIDQMIEIAVKAAMPAGLVLQLTDRQTPGDAGLLYRSHVAGMEALTTPRADVWATVLYMGNREWALTITTTPEYRKEHRPWMAWVVAVAGLMFVALLQILLLGMTGRTAMVLRKNEEIRGMSKTLEEKVVARTAELKEIMQSYRDQFTYNSAAMLVIKPNDGAIIDANGAALAFYGYPPEKMATLHIADLNHSPASDPLPSMTSVTKAQGRQFEFEQKLANGSVREVEVSCSVTHFGGQLALHLIIRDITDRKKAEHDLKAALREKEILLREIHHRVKNNMQMISSLLSLQAEMVENDQERQTFVESQQRILAMAMIHETLYSGQNLVAIDFADYVNRLATHLLGVYTGSNEEVRVLFELAEVNLSTDFAVPCGLILNELLTNAFKHAFSGRTDGTILIACHIVNEEELVLEVSDDGVGLPANLDLENPSTLGLKLIKGIAEHQLRGSWTVNVDQGTKFSFRWPLPVELEK